VVFPLAKGLQARVPFRDRPRLHLIRCQLHTRRALQAPLVSSISAPHTITPAHLPTAHAAATRITACSSLTLPVRRPNGSDMRLGASCTPTPTQHSSAQQAHGFCFCRHCFRLPSSVRLAPVLFSTLASSSTINAGQRVRGATIEQWKDTRWQKGICPSPCSLHAIAFMRTPTGPSMKT
jgi:hypothetical protein